MVSLIVSRIETVHNVHVPYSSEYTLTMGNIGRCLEDNVPLHMWKTLHQELRVPPRETAEEECTVGGVKLWLLTDPSASWQRFAMALYSSSLDGALKTLKALKLLPEKGLKNSPHFHYGKIRYMILDK